MKTDRLIAQKKSESIKKWKELCEEDRKYYSDVRSGRRSRAKDQKISRCYRNRMNCYLYLTLEKN